MGTVLRILAVMGIAFAAVPAQAQTYPSKPITVVVPFGPGSGTDLITRIIAQRLSTAVNQSVIVENKPGANGTLAAMQVAHGAGRARRPGVDAVHRHGDRLAAPSARLAAGIGDNPAQTQRPGARIADPR